MSAVYDKTGRQIKVGDVLKVYHFQGARWRKRYFMYKQVLREEVLRDGRLPFLRLSHLNLNDEGYWLRQDGQIEPEVEIVQGIDWHHDRPKTANRNPGDLR